MSEVGRHGRSRGSARRTMDAKRSGCGGDRYGVGSGSGGGEGQAKGGGGRGRDTRSKS